MCGRYYIDDEEDIQEMREIIAEISKKYADSPEHAQMKTGEIFPTNLAPVVGLDGPEIMRWGIPIYGSSKKAINARSETAAQKSMFSVALQQRRVVVPTTGFYEWKHEGKKAADQFLFRVPGQRVLYLAGLYTNIAKPDGTCENYYTILSTAANESMESYHDRMPIYVAAGERDTWIHDPASVGEILYRKQPELSAVKVVKGRRVDEGDQLGFF